MNYQAVLFDADGMTIVSKRFSDQVRDEYGISWESMEPFFRGPFQRCKIGKADLKEELAQVIHEWGWNGSVQELIEYWFRQGSELNTEVTEIALLLRKHGVSCFLSTDQEAYRADYLWNVVGLKDVFDGLLVSCDIGFTKNDVRYFQVAHDRMTKILGFQPAKHRVLFVDHEASKLSAARTFGFDTHMYIDPSAFRTIFDISGVAPLLPE